MSTFIIPCETYCRLYHAAKPAYADVVDARYWLNSLYIEHSGGSAVAVTTNARIAAAQQLDPTDQPDGCVNVVYDEELMAICAREAQWNAELIIDTIDIPGFRRTTARTTFGTTFSKDAAIYPPTPATLWTEWRNWFKMFPDDVAKKSEGFLFMDTELLTNLGLTAPSRRIVFPEKITTKEPTIVRDSVDPSWCGLFISYSSLSGQSLKAATRPEWIRKA